MPSETTDKRVIYALVFVGILTFLYSVLIAGRPLLWFVIAIALVFLYLAWRLLDLARRFVVAVERIASALEGESGSELDEHILE